MVSLLETQRSREMKCDGKCFIRLTDDLKQQCCYNSRGRCLINEYEDNYLVKIRRKQE